jgi:hypothetical protein
MQQEHSELHRLERCEAFIRSNFIEGPKPAGKRPHLVTLSREAYSRAHEVGEALMERLEADPSFNKKSWALFDKHLVTHVLEAHQLPKELAQYMPEDREHSWTSVINEIIGLHPSLWELFHHTCDTILKLATKGNVILIGRGAHILTRHFEGAVHARIVAPIEMRGRRAAEINACSYKAACRTIHHEDHGRAAYLRSHFDQAIDDPLAYDITLNTGRLTPADAAAALHALLRRRI